MAAGSSRTHLPVKYSMTGGGKLNQDRVLYNDIVDLCRKYAGAMFSEGAASVKGHKFISDVRDVLWSIDTHLDLMHCKGQKSKDSEVKFLHVCLHVAYTSARCQHVPPSIDERISW